MYDGVPTKVSALVWFRSNTLKSFTIFTLNIWTAYLFSLIIYGKCPKISYFVSYFVSLNFALMQFFFFVLKYLVEWQTE